MEIKSSCSGLPIRGARVNEVNRDQEVSSCVETLRGRDTDQLARLESEGSGRRINKSMNKKFWPSLKWDFANFPGQFKEDNKHLSPRVSSDVEMRAGEGRKRAARKGSGGHA